MAWKSILVNIEVDSQPGPIIGLAKAIASTMDARLVGYAAADIPMPVVTTEGMVVDGGFIEAQREDIEQRLASARAAFMDLVPDGEWRGSIASPTQALSVAARAADLIITASPDKNADNANHVVDVASVALHAGRPVLVAAADAHSPIGSPALVAWKDTREARRAVADALPLLALSSEVVVATVDRHSSEHSSESLADVASYLRAHGIAARTEILTGKDDAGAIVDFARGLNAGLLVSGAFGHSRLRQWVFGGVTATLLEDAALNRLVTN